MDIDAAAPKGQLASTAVRQPRRPRLGQHFLSDARYRQRIVEELDLGRDELVIEIGAGRGEMTGLLAQRVGRVVAIEVDAKLVERLREKFDAASQVEIVRADILSFDLGKVCQRLKTEKCFVFGNLPYYITSPILDHLRAFWKWTRAMGLLVQREVAARLTAKPGGRDYAYLTVLTQLYWEPRIALTVPPGAFSPQPRVHSALVQFDVHPKLSQQEPKEQDEFLDFVKACFAQKRKNLRNNLSRTYLRSRVESELKALGLSPTVRAEQLNTGEFTSLFSRLKK